MVLTRIPLLFLFAFALDACALSGDEASGKAVRGLVLDEETGKPVAGAIVVVRWHGDTDSRNPANWFTESRTICYRVETAISDKEGRYSMPSWKQPPYENFIVRFDRIVVDAYKQGYGSPKQPSQIPENVLLAPFSGSTTARLEYLERMVGATSCGGARESYRNLFRSRSGFYEEARKIANTPEEKRRAERFKDDADDVLVNRSKPTTYDKRGRLINVDPRDTFRAEELK